MVLGKSPKPVSGSCALRDAAPPNVDLNLPDAEGFRSLPPLVSLAKLIERNRQFRECFPAGVRSADERWRARVTEEFRL